MSDVNLGPAKGKKKRKKKKGTTIELGPKDAALVFKPDNSLPTIITPHEHEDEIASNNTITCVMLALALQDEEIMKLMYKKLDEGVEAAKEMDDED